MEVEAIRPQENEGSGRDEVFRILDSLKVTRKEILCVCVCVRVLFFFFLAFSLSLEVLSLTIRWTVLMHLPPFTSRDDNNSSLQLMKYLNVSQGNVLPWVRGKCLILITLN